MYISTTDLYRLRHIQLAARRMALKAQHAEQAYRELLLEMEHRYGLLGTEAVIDIHTGEVLESSSNDNRPLWEGREPALSPSKGQTQPFPGRTQELETNEAR